VTCLSAILQVFSLLQKKPIMINLEYLSAEPWILEFHGKASPQSHGIPKYFFFPGFQDEVGGLLLDPIPPMSHLTATQIPPALKDVWSTLRPGVKRVSVFCYPGAPLRKWLEDLNTLGEDFDILLTYGHAQLLGSFSGQQAFLPDNLQYYPFHLSLKMSMTGFFLNVISISYAVKILL
jgi:hypothetical protein